MLQLIFKSQRYFDKSQMHQWKGEKDQIAGPKERHIKIKHCEANIQI